MIDLVGADVLGDAAGLAGGDLGLADGVEQRGLAVVDVAHDRDHGGALDKVLIGVVEDRVRDRLILGVNDLDFLAELGGQHLDRLVGQGLRQRLHFPERHELLHHLGHGHVQVLGDVLDGRSRVDLDRGRLGNGGLRGTRFGLFVIDATAAASTALAPGRLVGLWRAAAGSAA